MLTAPPLAPAGPLGHREGPKLNEETMKRYRIDVCVFGSLGVPYARESYWASLGANEPSSLHLPSFGEYAEHQPRKEGGRIPLAAKMGRLPFEHHLRACTSAKALAKGTYPEMDAALSAFDEHGSVVARALGDAARYYARQEYERDDFDKGRELHTKLSDELAKFEEHHVALVKAYEAWLPGLEPIEEAAKLDAGGELSHKALAAARRLALVFVHADELPEVAVAEPLVEAVEALTASLERMRSDDPAASHARLVAPKLRALLEQVAAARSGTYDEHRRYLIGAAVAAVADADQRSLTLLLGGGQPFGALGRPKLPELSPMVGRRKKAPLEALPAGTSKPSTP